MLPGWDANTRDTVQQGEMDTNVCWQPATTNFHFDIPRFITSLVRDILAHKTKTC